MSQALTLKLKLHEPTRAKREMYQTMADRVTNFANRCLDLEPGKRPKTSKEAARISEPLPSAVLNQALRDLKARENARRFRRLWPGFNNQNFRVEKETSAGGGAVWKVSFPTLERRVGVPVQVSAYHSRYLEMLLAGKAKQGTAYLVRRRKDWYVHLSLTVPVERRHGPEKHMGIDLGLICLLVAWVAGRTFFVHGTHLAYVRRRFAKLRREFQKAGAYRALKKLGDREHRWVTDMNHKISRLVVDFAVSQGVTCIRMEDLAGVRWTEKQNRKQRRDHGRSLHCWPFRQLQGFIAYKAGLAGIRVEYVNREGTSATCSRCGAAVGRPSGRWFICPSCGARAHVDANAAANIAKAVSGLAA